MDFSLPRGMASSRRLLRPFFRLSEVLRRHATRKTVASDHHEFSHSGPPIVRQITQQGRRSSESKGTSSSLVWSGCWWTHKNVLPHEVEQLSGARPPARAFRTTVGVALAG